jgi:hypothetical protein
MVGKLKCQLRQSSRAIGLASLLALLALLSI